MNRCTQKVKEKSTGDDSRGGKGRRGEQNRERGSLGGEGRMHEKERWGVKRIIL
jgi:hypothetical protein